MGDQALTFQLPPGCQFQDLSAVACIYASGLEDQIFSVHLRQGKDLRLLIHGCNDDHSIGPCRLPGKPKTVLPACRLNDHIRSPSLGPLPQCFCQRDFRRIHKFVRQSLLSGKFQSAPVYICRHDAGRPVESCTHHSTKTGWSGPKHQDSISLPDLANLCRPVSRREQIPCKKCLLICHLVRDGRQRLVRKGDSHILCLAAVYPASQRPSAIFILTIIDKTSFAEKTLSAEGLHVDSHSLSGMYALYLPPGLLHNAYKFMPKDGSGHCPWHRAVFNVKITGADGSQRHSHNGICILFQLWKRPIFHTDLTFSSIYDRLHLFSSLPVFSYFITLSSFLRYV